MRAQPSALEHREEVGRLIELAAQQKANDDLLAKLQTALSTLALTHQRWPQQPRATILNPFSKRLPIFKPWARTSQPFISPFRRNNFILEEDIDEQPCHTANSAKSRPRRYLPGCLRCARQSLLEASDIASKDLIHGAQEAIGEIITAIDEQGLAKNTQLFIAFKPKIDAVNKALQTIKDEINQITKNIATAATVVSAISKVLTLWPA